MPAPGSVEELLKLIRKSGMIEEPRLEAYLERLRLLAAYPTDVRKLAGTMVKDGLLTYFQAEQFMLGKWRGFTIGKYKLLERIGFGGMGQVFLCEHMYMRRRVAVKVLPPAKAEEPAALGRFYREARAAAALDHPNIVRTHDIDQDGNLHFLVMEYVDGSSFLEIIKKKTRISIDRAVHYIWQSVQGLDQHIQPRLHPRQPIGGRTPHYRAANNDDICRHVRIPLLRRLDRSASGPYDTSHDKNNLPL